MNRAELTSFDKDDKVWTKIENAIQNQNQIYSEEAFSKICNLLSGMLDMKYKSRPSIAQIKQSLKELQSLCVDK